MQLIILIIINMENIRQERLTKGLILNFNKKHKEISRNNKFVTRVKESMAFTVLKK